MKLNEKKGREWKRRAGIWDCKVRLSTHHTCAKMLRKAERVCFLLFGAITYLQNEALFADAFNTLAIHLTEYERRSWNAKGCGAKERTRKRASASARGRQRMERVIAALCLKDFKFRRIKCTLNGEGSNAALLFLECVVYMTAVRTKPILDPLVEVKVDI